MRALIFAAFLFLAPTPLAAEKTDDRFNCDAADNGRLCEMYRKDQERRKPPILNLAALEDIEAVKEARYIAKDPAALRTGNDYFRVATLLLHSSKTEDYLLSYIVSTEGLMQAPDHVRVRLLAALSLDRFLVAKNRQQIFGTQTMGGDEKGPHWYPYDCLLNNRVRRVFLGNYPEPCPSRAEALLERASTQRTLLVDHVISTERLLNSPRSPAVQLRTAQSLDAYLFVIGEPQVFGTLTHREAPFARLDCTFLSSGIRNAFSVAGPCVQSDRIASGIAVPVAAAGQRTGAAESVLSRPTTPSASRRSSCSRDIPHPSRWPGAPPAARVASC